MTLEIMIQIFGFVTTLIALGISVGQILQKIKAQGNRLQAIESKINRIEEDKEEMNIMLVTHAQEIKFWKEVVQEVKEGVRDIRMDFKDMATDIRLLASSRK